MENEKKLRALLAEARREIATWHLGPRDPLVQRIDAALAEPVGQCFGCTAANLEGARLIEQRDEARADASLAETRLAEIVALVGEGGDGSAFGSVESMLATFTHRQEVLQKQRDEARAEVERAFRRGAEAMREAAAQLVDKMLSHTLTDAADRIRALTIPEDK